MLTEALSKNHGEIMLISKSTMQLLLRKMEVKYSNADNMQALADLVNHAYGFEYVKRYGNYYHSRKIYKNVHTKKQQDKTKICLHCGQELPISKFKAFGTGNYRKYCSDCYNAKRIAMEAV